MVSYVPGVFLKDGRVVMGSTTTNLLAVTIAWTAMVMLATGCPQSDLGGDVESADIKVCGDACEGWEELPPGEWLEEQFPQDVQVSPVEGIPFTRAVFDPKGRYLLAQVGADGGQQCLAVADLDEWTVKFPEGRCGLRWIAFPPWGKTAWLLKSSGAEVEDLGLAELSPQAQLYTQDIYSTMALSPEGDTLVLTNQPVTAWSESQYEWNTYNMDMRHLAALRPLDDGVAHEQTFPYAIRSVAFSPNDGAVLVAMSWWKEDGLPEAQVDFMNPMSGAVEANITFPNCADEVMVQPGGKLAILSPNQCFVHPIQVGPPSGEEDEWPEPEEEWEEWEEFDEGDPCSVIDLEKREFVGNLPGFGPVAFSPDGETAVAFSRQETMMKQWNMFQEEPVGLIFIRMEDLYWKVVEYGGDEPDYFFDPSGNNLLLHDREGGVDRILRMNPEDFTKTVYSGLPASLDERALSADGQEIFVASNGKLLRAALDGNSVVEVTLPFQVSQVFARPQGDFLVVVSPGNAALHAVDLAGNVLKELLTTPD